MRITDLVMRHLQATTEKDMWLRSCASARSSKLAQQCKEDLSSEVCCFVIPRCGRYGDKQFRLVSPEPLALESQNQMGLGSPLSVSVPAALPERSTRAPPVSARGGSNILASASFDPEHRVE